MLGLRKLWAKLTGSGAAGKVEHVAVELIGRAGLTQFINKYETLALAEFQKLANARNTEDLKVWYDEAEKSVVSLVKSDSSYVHDNWAGILFRLAIEAWQASRVHSTEPPVEAPAQ
jgi:hypothetical protein